VTEDIGTNPDHKTRVTLENQVGTALAVSDDDGTFDGRVIYDHVFSWTFPGSGPTLTNPARINIEALSVPGAPGGYRNQLILDWIEIRYRRLFQAESDALVFDCPTRTSSSRSTGCPAPTSRSTRSPGGSGCREWSTRSA
jgi:hypothetical protein